jgi:DNA-binding response OmpR family regulator
VDTDGSASAAGAARRGAIAYQQILIVEDEAMLRRVIARNLRGRGFEVREAELADDAIAMVLMQVPDLMLLDINLPDRTGWDVLRELRQRGLTIPTIIVSAVRVSQSRLNEFHPLAYLPKPFPLEALLRIVSQGRQGAVVGDT